MMKSVSLLCISNTLSSSHLSNISDKLYAIEDDDLIIIIISGVRPGF